MSILARDLILSGIVYVILAYLSFRLMKGRKPRSNDDEGGLPFELTPPEIDLPPGVSWPGPEPIKKRELEFFTEVFK